MMLITERSNHVDIFSTIKTLRSISHNTNKLIIMRQLKHNIK